MARMPRPPTENSHGAIPQTSSFRFRVRFPFVTRASLELNLGSRMGLLARRAVSYRTSPGVSDSVQGSSALSGYPSSVKGTNKVFPSQGHPPPPGHMVRVPPLSPVPCPLSPVPCPLSPRRGVDKGLDDESRGWGKRHRGVGDTQDTTQEMRSRGSLPDPGGLGIEDRSRGLR